MLRKREHRVHAECAARGGHDLTTKSEYNLYFEKAERFLTTATHALEIEDYDSCVSRCYYAMFFMAEAVLLTKGVTVSTHKGVISLFGKYFVKSGIFDRRYGRMISRAYDDRLVGDYGVMLRINCDHAKATITNAQEFVDTLQRYIQRIQ